ncbi:hypothetical protein KC332_g10235 [Hortaea werneckii]|uniref:SMODS and SLOG-associating 2TM effector domain-containing protein n=2 Tax=Hortaea werneckii TaxID=91943 RepID=A0A3M7IAR9_HORWE|nr:hypothetical protein KC358_g9951 [Hortaea werneckii]OTA32417.1 hypothetical protein BTJ68_08033 [Hortaea werneckii EXF-2000]KAI6823828.1 hypothetical protein KC350_g9147 [Hortaea werneckii]KAI6921641.1 hypothetical protein KC348_g10077 [Hortaea werneckii]KAI6930451.1 hypothetical protein KC341_g10225 [Hortaea werneckii]
MPFDKPNADGRFTAVGRGFATVFIVARRTFLTFFCRYPAVRTATLVALTCSITTLPQIIISYVETPNSDMSVPRPKLKSSTPSREPSPATDEMDFAKEPLRPVATTYGTLAPKPTIKPKDDSATNSTTHLFAETTSTPESDSKQTTFNDTAPLAPEAFRRLIGLRPRAHAGASPAELEAGHGLYHDIRTSYENARRAHLWFEIGVYTSLLGQVLLSANFIILGAMRGDHHVPIAVLGAVSVSIAGCLALVKGQGLPMRLRIERDALWEVQLEAEELHWSLAAGRPVMFNDVKRIWERFVQVKRDASLNHPDTWNSSAAAAAQPVTVPTKTAVAGNSMAAAQSPGANVSPSNEATPFGPPTTPGARTVNGEVPAFPGMFGP